MAVIIAKKYVKLSLKKTGRKPVVMRIMKTINVRKESPAR